MRDYFRHKTDKIESASCLENELSEEEFLAVLQAIRGFTFPAYDYKHREGQVEVDTRTKGRTAIFWKILGDPCYDPEDGRPEVLRLSGKRL